MKRFLILFILIVLPLGMMACDGEDGVDGLVGPTGIHGEDGKDIGHLPDDLHYDLDINKNHYVCKNDFHYAYHAIVHTLANDNHAGDDPHWDCYDDEGNAQ